MVQATAQGMGEQGVVHQLQVGGGVGSAASSMTVEGSGRGARIGLQVSGTGVGRGSPASGVVSRGSPRGPGAWGVSSFKVCLVWWTVHLVLVLA